MGRDAQCTFDLFFILHPLSPAGALAWWRCSRGLVTPSGWPHCGDGVRGAPPGSAGRPGSGPWRCHHGQERRSRHAPLSHGRLGWDLAAVGPVGPCAARSPLRLSGSVLPASLSSWRAASSKLSLCDPDARIICPLDGAASPLPSGHGWSGQRRPPALCSCTGERDPAGARPDGGHPWR